VTFNELAHRFFAIAWHEEAHPISRSKRFLRHTDADAARFCESISFDRRLWRHDILGSIAHATMLTKIGILTKKEQQAIVSGLDDIGQDIAKGKFRWRLELEDVHMNIEAELTRRVPAGAKLHTGRSRNDQVALDTRMWLRDEIFRLAREIAWLQRALLRLGQKYAEVLVPGYTHLQRAQPVYFAHHLLAYVEMLERDRDRLKDCFHRVNICPLGSGALAGSTLRSTVPWWRACSDLWTPAANRGLPRIPWTPSATAISRSNSAARRHCCPSIFRGCRRM